MKIHTPFQILPDYVLGRLLPTLSSLNLHLPNHISLGNSATIQFFCLCRGEDYSSRSMRNKPGLLLKRVTLIYLFVLLKKLLQLYKQNFKKYTRVYSTGGIANVHERVQNKPLSKRGSLVRDFAHLLAAKIKHITVNT